MLLGFCYFLTFFFLVRHFAVYHVQNKEFRATIEKTVFFQSAAGMRGSTGWTLRAISVVVRVRKSKTQKVGPVVGMTG